VAAIGLVGNRTPEGLERGTEPAAATVPECGPGGEKPFTVSPLHPEGRRALLRILTVMALLAVIPLSLVVDARVSVTGDGGWLAPVAFTLMAVCAVSCVLSAAADAMQEFKKRKTAWLPVLGIALSSLFTLCFMASCYSLASTGLPWPSAATTSIRLVPGRPEMMITGDIQVGLTRRVRGFLDRHPHVTTVHLHSLGGSGQEGVKLAELIRERNLSTYVAHRCNSACTIAFSAGRSRMILGTAAMGYHNGGILIPYVGAIPLPRSASFPIANAYSRNGVSREFVDRALDFPMTDVWQPTPQEMLSANVVTEVVDEGRFAMSWSLDIAGAGSDRRVDAIYQLHSWRPARVLETVSREDRQALYDIVLAAYDEGLTEAEMRRRVSLAGAAAIRGLVATGDDASVVLAGHMLHAAMAKLDGVDDTRCARIGIEADLMEAATVLYGKDFDTYWIVRELVGKSPMASVITYRPEAVNYRSVSADNAAMSCHDALRRFALALSLPEPESARFLRGMIKASSQDMSAGN